MLQTYRAVNGQSAYDVCLNTYGSLDFLYKLLQDSGAGSVDDEVVTGQPFYFNDDLIVDQIISAGLKGAKLATMYSPAVQVATDGQQSLKIISQQYATALPAGNLLAPDGSGQIITNMYEITKADNYTAGAENEVTVAMPQWIGWGMTLVIKEGMPVKPVNYTWNGVTGQLALLNGLALSKDETIFMLFNSLIQP